MWRHKIPSLLGPKHQSHDPCAASKNCQTLEHILEHDAAHSIMLCIKKYDSGSISDFTVKHRHVHFLSYADSIRRKQRNQVHGHVLT